MTTTPSSCALVGCLIGSLVTGGLSDPLGRKKLLLASAFLFAVSSVMTGWAHNFQAFVCWRIVGGMAIGMASALSPMYLAEMAPASTRGKDWDLLERGLARLIEEAIPATMLPAGIRASYQKGLGHAAQTEHVDLVAQSKQAPVAVKTQSEAVIMKTDALTFLQKPELSEEIFGPFALLVTAQSREELKTIARGLNGQLTATVHASSEDFREAALLLKIPDRKAGRLIINGFPTGVEVCSSMHHGGPCPATTDARFTSVGTAAVLRFARPLCFQNFAQAYLPEALRNDNPLGIRRLVNGSPESP